MEMEMELENAKLVFSSFSFGSWKTRQKLTIVCSLFEKIIRFPSLDVLGVFRVGEKVFDLIFSAFSPKNVKIPVRESL